MSRRPRHRHTENVQRFLSGPGGRGACSVTDRATIKRTTAKRRRVDDEDHVDEGLLEVAVGGDRVVGKCGVLGRA